jgi:hypothetical protein
VQLFAELLVRQSALAGEFTNNVAAAAANALDKKTFFIVSKKIGAWNGWSLPPLSGLQGVYHGWVHPTKSPLQNARPIRKWKHKRPRN